MTNKIVKLTLNKKEFIQKYVSSCTATYIGDLSDKAIAKEAEKVFEKIKEFCNNQKIQKGETQ